MGPSDLVLNNSSPTTHLQQFFPDQSQGKCKFIYPWQKLCKFVWWQSRHKRNISKNTQKWNTMSLTRQYVWLKIIPLAIPKLNSLSDWEVIGKRSMVSSWKIQMALSTPQISTKQVLFLPEQKIELHIVRTPVLHRFASCLVVAFSGYHFAFCGILPVLLPLLLPYHYTPLERVGNWRKNYRKFMQSLAAVSSQGKNKE